MNLQKTHDTKILVMTKLIEKKYNNRRESSDDEARDTILSTYTNERIESWDGISLH